MRTFFYNKDGGKIMAAITKNNRIHIRVSDKDKQLLELAALYRKQNLSAYIFDIAIRQAELDIKESETISLNNQQRDRFLELLENPPKANQALKDLFKNDL